MTDPTSAPPLDLQRRRLCPDGACLGVVGPDGRCRTCGERDPEAPPGGLGPEAFAGGCVEPDEDEIEAESRGAGGEAGPAGELRFGADGDVPFDPTRALCPDGACTGLLGPDGRCKTCGASAQAER